MIPPVAPSILSANPQFASLHAHVTTSLLNHPADASTRATALLVHRPVEEELSAHHMRAVKEEVLMKGLGDVAIGRRGGKDELPHELRDLVLDIATYLVEARGMGLSEDDHWLLEPQVEAFRGKVDVVGKVLSQDLQRQRERLVQIAQAGTSGGTNSGARGDRAERKGGDDVSLPGLLSSRLQSLQHTQQVTIPAARVQLANSVAEVLRLHSALLTAQIRLLELHTHGSLSRHTRAHAERLCTVSTGLDAKTKLLLLQALHKVYTAEVQDALRDYDRRSREAAVKLEQREALLQSELDLYHRVGEDGGIAMREVGRRYGEVLSQIDRVKEEITRLERRDKEN